MKKQREPKIATSFRLSKTAYDLLHELVKTTGLARTACLELAIRELHAQHRHLGHKFRSLVVRTDYQGGAR